MANHLPILWAVASGNGQVVLVPGLLVPAGGGLWTIAPGVISPALHAATHALTGSDPLSLDKSQVGLGNVDNTADANKSVLYAATAGGAPPTGSASGDLTGTYPGPSLANAGPGVLTKGTAARTVTVTTDAKGRVSALSDQDIAIAQSQVTNLTTDLAAKVPLAGGTMTGTLVQKVSVDFPTLAKPTSSPVAALAGTGGLCAAGSHGFYVTYYTAVGETEISAYAASAYVTVPVGGDAINLTGIPVSADPSVIGRRLYKTPPSYGTGAVYLVATIANNTATTYTFNAVEPGSYTNAWFRDNTTNKFVTSNGSAAMLLGSSSTTLGLLAAPGIIAGTANGGANVSVGYGAAYSLTAGANGTFVGAGAGNGVTTGSGNTCLGMQAGYYLQTTASNTTVGVSAGRSTRGNNNTVVGYYAMASQGFAGTPQAHTNNAALGYQAMYAITTGSSNVGIGALAGNNLTTASSCVVLGAGVQLPSATLAGQLNIGNVIYGLNLYGNGFGGASAPQATGRVGIGLTTPTARLHLPASTTSASSAPLKMDTGVLMTAAEAGAVEYDGTAFYGTNSGAVRKAFVRQEDAIKVGASGTSLTQMRVYTPTLTPTAVGAATSVEQTYTVTGLATTDTVTVNHAGHVAGLVIGSARVSATDTLAITWANVTAGSLTPTSGTYRILAVRS